MNVSLKLVIGKKEIHAEQKWSTQIMKEGLKDLQHATRRNAFIKLSFIPLNNCLQEQNAENTTHQTH